MNELTYALRVTLPNGYVFMGSKEYTSPEKLKAAFKNSPQGPIEVRYWHAEKLEIIKYTKVVTEEITQTIIL